MNLISIPMIEQQQHRLMLKILIGAAWFEPLSSRPPAGGEASRFKVDGFLQPEELAYLQRLLHRYSLDQDAELNSLLQAPVALENTTQWMVAYLTDSTETERLQLLGAIGQMVVADDQVSAIEHDFLDWYHTLMAKIPAHPEAMPTLVQTLGGFFKKVARSVQDLASDRHS